MARLIIVFLLVAVTGVSAYQCCAGSSVCPNGGVTSPCGGSSTILCCPGGSTSVTCSAGILSCDCGTPCSTTSQNIITYSTDSGNTYRTLILTNGGSSTIDIGRNNFALVGFDMSTKDMFTVQATMANGNNNDPSVSAIMCSDPQRKDCDFRIGLSLTKTITFCASNACTMQYACTGFQQPWVRYDNNNGVLQGSLKLTIKVTRTTFNDVTCSPPTIAPTSSPRPTSSPLPTAFPTPSNTFRPPTQSGDLTAPLENQGLSTGGIVGIVLCVIVVILTIVVVTLMVMRSKKSKEEAQALLQTDA